MAATYKVVCSLFESTYKEIGPNGAGKRRNNTILMGSYVKLLDESTLR